MYYPEQPLMVQSTKNKRAHAWNLQVNSFLISFKPFEVFVFVRWVYFL